MQDSKNTTHAFSNSIIYNDTLFYGALTLFFVGFSLLTLHLFILGMCLSVAGIILSIRSSGFQIDYLNKRIRKYHAVLGQKRGQWISIENIERLVIKKVNSTNNSILKYKTGLFAYDNTNNSEILLQYGPNQQLSQLKRRLMKEFNKIKHI